jgi:hypothetical protein
VNNAQSGSFFFAVMAFARRLAVPSNLDLAITNPNLETYLVLLFPVGWRMRQCRETS